MTEFGLLLSELMRERGITEPGELSVRLIEAGYWFTEQTVRDYMSGRVEQPDPTFGRGVAEVLRLDEEEKMNLVTPACLARRASRTDASWLIA